MVGVVVTSALLELVVYPALYLIWKGRGRLKRQESDGRHSSRSCFRCVAQSRRYMLMSVW